MTMSSERQKREEEIERLMQGVGLSRERDIAFQEEVRKVASAIAEQEARKIQKTERGERLKQPISPRTAGLWILVLGAGLALSMPSLGAVIIVCGIAAIVWDTFLKSAKK
ncbi:MAG TPA: hypothetical protein VLJ79_18040 [Candidatus Binatia bacterium]|nr:hypothetical protein [Candidatus Binatia bacterium]